MIAYGDDVLRHRRFIVSAGIGLDAEVCQHMQRSAIKNICNRIHLRRLSYRILGFIQYLKAKPIRGYILLDGTRRVEFNYIYFISAQIQPCEGGGFWFAPKADSSDGNLEVCIVSHASKRQVLGTLLGRCSGAPTTGGFGASAAGGPDLHGTPDGSSRGRRELSVPEQSGSPLY